MDKPRDEKDEQAGGHERAAGQEIRHWDVVDEASDESFPASDPPAWSSSHAAPTEESATAIEPEVEAVEPAAPGWLQGRARQIAIGVGALGALFGIRRLRHRRAT